MAVLDISTASDYSKNINQINPPNDITDSKPIDLSDPVIIAKGFHAGIIDSSQNGWSGVDGVGLVDVGLYGFNEGDLHFLLAADNFNIEPFGLLTPGELRIGDDVSADSSGVINGNHYLRYIPSAGLDIVGGNISVSSGGYIWTGTGLTDDPSTPTGIGILGGYTVDSVSYDGLYAWNTAHELTVQIKASDGSFKVGSSTQYLEYDASGLNLVGGNLTISSGNYVWVGTDFDNGIGLAENVSGVSGLVATHGGYVTALIDSSTGGFTLGKTGDAQIVYTPTDGMVTLTNSNILITSTSSSAGFIWVGSNTDVSVDGVGINYQGITGAVSGKATFKVMTDGTLYVGPDYFNQTATDASIAFDGTDLDIQNVNLNITTTGVGYVWLGNTSLNQGVGLATGISGYDTGFYAANGGDITVAISAEDGSFTFGEISGPNISYDGSILALIDTSIDVTGGYVWAGSGTPGTGTGVGLISTGFYGFNGTTQTAFISATDGTFQFGPDGKCVKYDGSTLAVTGSNLTLSSGNYVWVGTPFVGVGFNEDGLLATDSGGTTTAYILANDGSFSFGKSGGNQLSYNPSTGDITLNGATISDWGDVSGSNLPAQNATVGATAGTNMYSSGGSTIPEAEVLNYTQGRGAYDGVSFPDITGKPMAINAYITTGGTGGWYKVASVTFGGQYGAFSFHGLFSKGESAGRVTTQSRVKLGCTSDASNNVSSPFYRYSGDNPTTYLKLRYSGTTVTLYCWLAQYGSVVLQGNWTCYPKSGGSSWFDNYQTDLDTIGSSDPGGTNVTATANYELEATVGSTAGINLYRGSGSTLYDADVITSQGTADDVEYGSGKAVYQAHADRTSLNTADNTDHVNDATTDSGSYYVIDGEIKLINGKDITFYDESSNYTGGIYGSENGSYVSDLIVDGENHIFIDAYSYLYLSGTHIYVDNVTAPFPGKICNLGMTSSKWNYIYANYLGAFGTNITSAYITTGNFSTVNTSYISATTQSTAAKYVNQTKENWFGHPDVGKKVKMVYYTNPNDTTEAGHLWFYTSNAQS